MNILTIIVTCGIIAAIGIPVILYQAGRLKAVAKSKYGKDWRRYDVSDSRE